MKRVLKLVVVLIAGLFVVLGLRWLVQPAGIAPEFGFELASGLGRSSQVGDMFGYFLVVGLCIFAALLSTRRIWYYPPIMLLGLTAFGRLIAWLVHDADFAGQMIGVELVTVAVLLLAAARLPERE